MGCRAGLWMSHDGRMPGFCEMCQKVTLLGPSWSTQATPGSPWPHLPGPRVLTLLLTRPLVISRLTWSPTLSQLDLLLMPELGVCMFPRVQRGTRRVGSSG